MIWDPTNGTRALFTLPGMVASMAFGINNAGQVTGFYSLGNEHAYVWLPAPAGTLPAGLTDIHDSIIWSSTDGASLNNPPSGQTPQVVGTGHTLTGAIHGFIWDSINGMRDLNGVVTNLPAGWRLVSANAINDNGLIVGNATDASGKSHGYILTPNLGKGAILR
jgi:probable HAF family extracellular repeat protein